MIVGGRGYDDGWDNKNDNDRDKDNDNENNNNKKRGISYLFKKKSDETTMERRKEALISSIRVNYISSENKELESCRQTKDFLYK